ncbi:hypothetical protein HHL25_05350 [Rhizobium sp. S-51]|jgi:hypothetical protein|uniref:Uncharacterized protein n=1 Tax=Rhizobium terricola TaxID=2728849 RepID=A0A7Y0AU64_9HYPH|nr:hypothetical protein [Rhizobium terricola]NML73551.1 hypothetical protein [Rhizobium terricola]
MYEREQLEVWALRRAEEIVLREGVGLMQAAQWLDKKMTVRTSKQLRNAICNSLLEAMALPKLPSPPEQNLSQPRIDIGA